MFLSLIWSKIMVSIFPLLFLREDLPTCSQEDGDRDEAEEVQVCLDGGNFICKIIELEGAV